ncbi:ABC transporter permease, partial [Corallococcus exiguus]|nr:ABC transporter permease [Corallococcus exiguus]
MSAIPAQKPRPAAPDRPLPASLRRNAPLVPVDSAGGRALTAVIAILTFLAALCAGGAELVAASSA